jgi:hypothetical protein
VWLPWSALLAVRTSATSATYHCRATGWPDNASYSSGSVREHSPVDFSTVTSTSDSGARGTSDDDTTGSGHFLLPGSATDHAYVVTAGVSAYHRSTRLRDTNSHHSAQSTGVFTASDVHYTEGRGFGTGGPLPSSDHGTDLVSTCLRHCSSCSRGYYSSRGHSDSDFRHRDDYSSTSSTSSGSRSFLSDLVSSQRG